MTEDEVHLQLGTCLQLGVLWYITDLAVKKILIVDLIFYPEKIIKHIVCI